MHWLTLGAPAAVFLATLGVGCDGADKENSAPTASASTPSDAKAAPAAREANPVPAAEALSEKARFDKATKTKECELLTPALVAKLFDVPEAELKQVKAGGCFYSWANGDEEVKASMQSIRVFDSEKKAARWHRKATSGASKADAEAAMAKVQAKLKADGKLDTAGKEQAAGALAAGVTASAGSDGFQYEDIDGVGDEARILKNTAEIWVRVDNLTFIVGAYKGQKYVDPKPATLSLEHAKGLQKREQAYVQETFAERQAAAKTVGTALVEALANAG